MDFILQPQLNMMCIWYVMLILKSPKAHRRRCRGNASVFLHLFSVLLSIFCFCSFCCSYFCAFDCMYAFLIFCSGGILCSFHIIFPFLLLFPFFLYFISFHFLFLLSLTCTQRMKKQNEFYVSENYIKMKTFLPSYEFRIVWPNLFHTVSETNEGKTNEGKGRSLQRRRRKPFRKLNVKELGKICNMSLVGLLHHFQQFLPVWWRWQSSVCMDMYVCLFVYAVRVCVVSIALERGVRWIDRQRTTTMEYVK